MSNSQATSGHHRPCDCKAVHEPLKIVLTGGPGAGKTAVLEMIKQSFCEHVNVLPEAAGIVFGGGFPRRADLKSAQAAQRAIFFVQRELEDASLSQNPAIILCDRGTVDGASYWRGEPDLWTSVSTSLEEQLARYATVIHLQVPTESGGYDHSNPLRIESSLEAQRIDQSIAELWSNHGDYHCVPPQATFIAKAQIVVALLAQRMPECCRSHALDEDRK